jgi:UDP-2,4-diacetamido-2,4,6-trideoxy-beta-L-altropyranose hydrolase
VKVVFRVDASDAIASGHVTRCLTLAAALRRREAECVFISRQVSGNLLSRVVAAGFEQRVLPGQHELHAVSDTTEESRESLIDDAMNTIKALGCERPRWMVVDHYAIDSEWERLVQPHVDEILVIDDLANRPHQCDVLLDQNFSLLGEQRYADLERHDTRLLCGPRYALLQPEFSRYRATLDRQRSNALRALVSFGGSDLDNLTGLTLEAFLAPDLADIALDVAIGRNNPHRDALMESIARRPGARAHIAPDTLAPLMARADFAVGAGGSTTWERFCLDLPSVVVALAQNQVQTCESLDATSRIEYAGYWSNLTASDLSTAAIRVVTGLKRAEARSPEPLVDGLGADRVAEVMTPTQSSALVMRPATLADIDSYYWWVNDAEVRRQSLSTAPVSWVEHERWFASKMAADDTLMLVLEANDLPIGQVRFDLGEGGAVLDYSLDTIVRGRGLGETLVRKGLEQLSQSTSIAVSATVRTGNGASAATLTAAGFQLAHPDGDAEAKEDLYRFEPALVDQSLAH